MPSNVPKIGLTKASSGSVEDSSLSSEQEISKKNDEIIINVFFILIDLWLFKYKLNNDLNEEDMPMI